MPKTDLEVSRDGRRVYFSNSLYSNWDEQFYPDSLKGWVAKADVDDGDGFALDPDFFVDFGEERPHQIRLPMLLELSGKLHEMEHEEHWGHGMHLFLTDPGALADIAAVAVHTLSMFAVMAAVALIVYDRLGLMILKRTWFNVDLLWAALVGVGAITLII